MTRSAPLQMKRSNAWNLVAGLAVAVALGIAIVAASPRFRPAAPAAGAGVAAPDAVSASHPALAARESQFDFGSISMAAGKVSHRYWIRNESADPLLIKGIYTSCMCTTASLSKGARVVGNYGMPGHGPLPEVNEALAPNETAYVNVVFDPAAHGPAGLGLTERVVTIEHAAGAPLKLRFTADVRP